ncbi:hypothetical protein [Streptomyces sp. NPDC086838]
MHSVICDLDPDVDIGLIADAIRRTMSRAADQQKLAWALKTAPPC